MSPNAPVAFDTALSAYQRSPSPVLPKGASETESRKAAEDFTSFFMSQMLEIMFQGIPTDGPFGGGPAEGIFRSMMLQEYGKTLARTGGFNLTDTVTREIIKMQEAQ